MTTAIITAAGIGSRMHQEIPKQFLCVYDKPIFIYTLEVFQKHPGIDKIVLVTLDSWKELVWAYAKQFKISKLKWVVSGGNCGQSSIRNGLIAIKNCVRNDEAVMIHDGNRPLVSDDIISNNLSVYKLYGNAVTAIPCVEVLFKSRNFEPSKELINRNEILRTQTPHTYKFLELWNAHEKARKQGILNTAATCDLMQQLGGVNYFSRGSDINFKITTMDDLYLFRAVISSRIKPR